MTIDSGVADWFDASKMEGEEYLAELCDEVVPAVMALVGSKVPIAMMGASVGGLATI